MLTPCHLPRRLTDLDCHSILDIDETTGCLLVEHRYPRQSTSEVHQAYVDVDLVLETTKKDTFVLGTWINVIGYVLKRGQEGGREVGAGSGTRKHMASQHLPRVQAILVWSAGAVHLEEYERVVQKTIDLRRAHQGR